MRLSSTMNKINIESYISKLKKVFELILNDEPDNRDDTINTKLIDALKRDFSISKNNLEEHKILIKFLKSFLEKEIINTELKYSILNLENKESDVIKFFLDLIQIYMINNIDDQQFEKKLVQLIENFLAERSLNLHEIDSCILCSLFDLINIMQNEKINTLLLTQFNFNLFLNHNYKSMYVRKSYKEILKTHIISSIKKLKLTKKLDSREGIISVLSFFSSLSVDIKLNNLDVFSDVFSHFMFSNDIILADVEYLINEIIVFHQNFQMNRKDYINNIENFSNDYAIESFAYNICFDLIFEYFSSTSFKTNDFDMKTNQLKQNASLDEIFTKGLMEIIKSAINSYYNFNNLKNNIMSIQIANFLFKFQFYFFSFVIKFECCYQKNDILKFFFRDFSISFDKKIEVVKECIRQTITFPFKFTFNRYTNSITTYDHSNEISFIQIKGDVTYESLSLLNHMFKFETKMILLKQSAINLKLLLTKFKTEKFDLFKFINMNQFNYLLRHLNIDLNLKHLTISILCDFFDYNHNETMVQVQNVIDFIIIEKLAIKINDTYDEYLFKLAAICINLALSFNSKQLIQLILLNYDNNTNFLLTIKFLTMILNETKVSLVGLNFIIELLDKHNSIILKKCTSIVQKKENESDNEIKESIFNFFGSIFTCLNSKIISFSNLDNIEIISNHLNNFVYDFEELIFTNDFLINVEALCLVEPEAFMRREIIKFLKTFHLYKFKLWLIYLNKSQTKSIKICRSLIVNMNKYIWNFVNYFAYILINDFDWEIQLYCIKLFQEIFNSTFELLAINSYELRTDNLIEDSLSEFSNINFIETICCLSNFFKSVIKSLNDYDQFVKSQSAQLLYSIKSNLKFINILIELNKKHNQLFQKEFRSTQFHLLKIKIEQSGKQLNVGTELFINDNYESNINNDEENYLNIFLNVIQTEDLNIKLSDLNFESYLYKNNTISIMDDITNSFKFELNNQKSVDCY